MDTGQNSVVIAAVAGLGLGAGLCSVAAAMLVVANRPPPVIVAPPPAHHPLTAVGEPPPQRWGNSSKALRAPTQSPRATAGASGGWDTEPPSSSMRRTNSEAKLELMNDLQDDAIRQGFSMKEAMSHSEQSAQQAKARTPEQVLGALQKGNTRFWMGVAKRPELSAFERRALIVRQHPSVAILGCSDSRVPIEIVFDQGLGDIFVIRVAGNCLDQTTMGSLEYATVHLGVKVLMVMGHEGCGAVKASRLPIEAIDKESELLGALLKSIKGGLDESRLSQIMDQRACDREAVVSNVKVQVRTLCDNRCVQQAVKNKQLLVCGAFYDMSSGIVDFFDPDDDICGQVVGSSSPRGK
jgi:carbonic anhydrase